MNRITSILAAGALTVGLVGVADVATAKSWYSASKPLKAVEDGVTQGLAYGDYYNSNGTYARSKSTRRDYRAGGDGVYVQTTFYFFYKPQASQEPYWVPTKQHQTTRTTSGRWVSDDPAVPLRGNSSQARGGMKVCEDQNLSPDPCSATAYRSFSY